METRTVADSLRISAEGAALAEVLGESGYWGPLASAPFSLALTLRFTFRVKVTA